MRSNRTLVTLIALLVPLLVSGRSAAQIVRDATPGQTPGPVPQDGTLYVLDGRDGIRRGGGEIVVHSLDRFGLAAGETARYTDDRDSLSVVQHVLTRVTGGTASQLDGRIESQYATADLLFANPNGIFFGEGFTVDVPGSFHFSTADTLEWDMGGTPIDLRTPAAIPTLSPAQPFAWGFLGAGPEKQIVVNGFRSLNQMDPAGESFSFIGSDVFFEDPNFDPNQTPGIVVETAGRTLTAVGLGAAGQVRDFVFPSDMTALTSSGGILNQLPMGNIRVRGIVDTSARSGSNFQPGSIFFQSFNFDLNGVLRAVASDQGVSAGNFNLFTSNALLDGVIATNSARGNAGDIILFTRERLHFAEPGATLEAFAAGGTQVQGGNIILQSSAITGNLNATTGLGLAGGDSSGGTIGIVADRIELSDVFLQARHSGTGQAGVITFSGAEVLLAASLPNAITTRSAGSGPGGLIGFVGLQFDPIQTLDFRGIQLNTSNSGIGNAGDIFINAASFTGDASVGFDVSAVSGSPGTITVGQFTVAAAPPGLVPLPPLPTVPPPGTTPPVTPPPVTPPPTNTASSGNDPVVIVDSIQQLISNLAIVGPGIGGAIPGIGELPPQSGSLAANDASDEDRDVTLATSDASPESEATTAAVSAAAQEEKERSHAVPGVALFTNASQRAPLVPRTCDARASDAGQSKLLASRRPGLPTSPEDWLLAFDHSGDELLLANKGAALPSVAAVAGLAEPVGGSAAQRALTAAAVALRGDRYGDASRELAQAAAAMEAAGDHAGASETLLAFAQLQLEKSRFEDARDNLEHALRLAEQSGDPTRSAAVRASLGNALVGTGELGRAREELTRGIGLQLGARETDETQTSDVQGSSATLNNLGNGHAATRDYESALWAYERAARLAREAGHTGDEARALAGAARAASDLGRMQDARSWLARAAELSPKLETRDRTTIAIHTGRSYARLAQVDPSDRAGAFLAAHAAFSSASAGATQLGDDRTLALAQLNLGALYREEQHRSEALYLTRQARAAAERADASDLLYRAHWQEGRILWAEHRVVDALAAHRRAVAILEQSKPVASSGYGASDADFQRTVGRVYLDSVDLMLRASDLATTPALAQKLVAEARDTLEKLKGAELRDYFEDECIADVRASKRQNAAGSRAAVIYTVTLPDRLELLVDVRGKLQRFTQNVPAARLIDTIDRMRHAVQNPLSRDHVELGQRLYDWTVAPYAAWAADAGVETLVFIPDGRLRTLPFAALHDQGRYLGERYALATALSLRLLAPVTLQSEPGRAVLAGVSDSVQGFSPLAAVPNELAQIQALEGGDVLLNQKFTLSEVRAAVGQETPGIVHLATHAVFTGNPDTSFLLTYGERVGFDDLSDIVGMTRADGAPLDLLVLSACETAVGNDRAGLGFTGSAIRAGARSALGSLWPIADEAAGRLMIDFYRGLQSPELTKAEALRRAQTALRTSDEFNHPFYWAPFTLVNDWL